jgi:hypothetical protein
MEPDAEAGRASQPSAAGSPLGPHRFSPLEGRAPALPPVWRLTAAYLCSVLLHGAVAMDLLRLATPLAGAASARQSWPVDLTLSGSPASEPSGQDPPPERLRQRGALRRGTAAAAHRPGALADPARRATVPRGYARAAGCGSRERRGRSTGDDGHHGDEAGKGSAGAAPPGRDRLPAARRVTAQGRRGGPESSPFCAEECLHPAAAASCPGAAPVDCARGAHTRPCLRTASDAGRRRARGAGRADARARLRKDAGPGAAPRERDAAGDRASRAHEQGASTSRARRARARPAGGLGEDGDREPEA